MPGEGRRILDKAYDELESELPDKVARVVHWLRAPERWWLRIGIGLLFIAAGLLWFLPVVGIEFLPVGLLLIAQDIPFLQKPVGNAMLWVVEKFRELRERWRARKRRKAAR
jgi:hypothetical protein